MPIIKKDIISINIPKYGEKTSLSYYNLYMNGCIKYQCSIYFKRFLMHLIFELFDLN